MKRLYLLRHAKSSWRQPGFDDFERPLKRRGVEACALIADYMRRAGVAPDLVLCSSARRARDTLVNLYRHLDGEPPGRYLDDLYMASVAELLEAVRSVDDNVRSLMVVGHNPGLVRLARALAGGGERAALAGIAGKYPTGALASLELACASWAEAAPGGARLVAFATPKALAGDGPVT